MVAKCETPVARAKRDTTLSSSPAALAPVPLGSSAAPWCTDATIDVPKKDISASPNMALWSMEGKGEQGTRRRNELGDAEELAAGELFYRPSTIHWPLRRYN